MLSMPPDRTMLAEPALMMSCASMVAFMPEPQTLFTVVAPVASGRPAPRPAWPAGAWPGRGLGGRGLALTGRQHIAHEDFVDLLRRELRPIERGADHMRAELVGGKGRQLAHETTERGAGGGKDNDGIGGGGHGGTP